MTENIIITQDKNLQIYLTGDPETFADLCRKFKGGRDDYQVMEVST